MSFVSLGRSGEQLAKDPGGHEPDAALGSEARRTEVAVNQKAAVD